MKKLITICAVMGVILGVVGVSQAASITDRADYKPSTDLSIGAMHTIRGGTDYELTGFGISEEFQINLLYQEGILDSDIDPLNDYWVSMGWTYNFGDNQEYVLNVSATGGLTIYEIDGLTHTIGGPEIKWTLTAWHQTILAGDIVEEQCGSIFLRVLPESTYRPFVGDPPVNNVEIFDGDLDCEVLGYKFNGAIADIGSGSTLSVVLVYPEVCTTIQDGTIVDTKGNPVSTGYDQWGYNYQAHMFNGLYGNASRPDTPLETDDIDLQMKWNDAWLSNNDCDGDSKLDRYYGFDSYIGSGAWLTNHQSGSYLLPPNAKGKEKRVHWTYFIKIVAVPCDAYMGVEADEEDTSKWYEADGIEIGPEIWGAFAIIQEVENDPGAAIHGKQYLSPAGPGFGQYSP